MSLFHQSNFIESKDPRNPFTLLLVLDQENFCYIEPGFMALLRAIDEREPHHIPLIVREIEALVKHHKKVVFALDFENPITRHIEDYIILELQDILNRLDIHFYSVNTGSHLGD